MDFILYFILFVFGILQIILFFKVWGMTNDVEIMKKNMIGIEGNVGNLKIKVCNRGLTNAQLSKRVMELKYTGQGDEAKKLVDQNLMLDVFNIICLDEKSVEKIKEKVNDVILWYDKYYKVLNCEMPNEIKEIDVEKVVRDYSSL